VLVLAALAEPVRREIVELERWLEHVLRPSSGPASRLDALDTELRRGRRRRALEEESDDRSAG
jgi:hypothetical protein